MEAVTGSISAIGGLIGAVGGLRGARAGAGIGPLFSVLSGQEQQQAARGEAGLLGRQADIAFEESLREAARVDRQVKSFREQQALEFASSGGLLAGSPLGVLEETRRLGQMEVDAIRRRGEALSGLLGAESLQMLRRGSAASFGGFANSLQQQFASKVRSASLTEEALGTGFKSLGLGTQALGSFGPVRNFASGFSQGFGQGFAGRSMDPNRIAPVSPLPF